MKHKKIVLLLIIVSLLLIEMQAPRIVSAKNGPSSTDITLNSTIIFANYTDWDSDQVEDDIYVILSLDFNGIYKVQYMSIDIYVTLELPSGTILTSFIRVSVLSQDQVITLYSLNSATEAGWYIITIATKFTGNQYVSDISVSDYIFDPPTESGNGLPT